MPYRIKSVSGILLVVAACAVGTVNGYELSGTTVETDGAGAHNRIAVDQNDHFVHIVYFDEVPRELKHAVLDDSGEWQIRTIDDSPGTIFDLDLYVDSKGNAHVAYIRSGPELVYAEFKSTSWYKTDIYNWSNSWGQYLQVAIGADLNGHPYVVYQADFNYLQMTYEDRETPYPFSWTTLSDLPYRAAWSGIDLDVIHAATSEIPKVNILYRRNIGNIVELLTFDLSDYSWTQDEVRDFGTAYPPYSLSYQFENDTHHVGYLWVADSNAGCFSCGNSRAHHIHSTAAGWSTPEAVSVQGFPDNIRYLSDVGVTSTNEPVFAAVGASDPNVYFARKMGGTWDTGGTDDGSRSLYALQLDLDACNDLHISAHDNLDYYDDNDDKLAYFLGGDNPRNSNCVIQPSQTSSGSSGYGSNRCRAVTTSYTELPRLDCDFSYLRELVKLKVCGFGGRSCSFSGAGMSHERSRAEADTFRRVADITADLLNNAELPRRSSIDDLRDDIERLFEQHNLLDAGNVAAIKTISRNTKRSDLLHTLARLMHKASLAESVPEPVSLDINTGAWVSSDLDNIAWLSMRDVNRAGTLTLDITDEKGQIKLPSGGSILWPAAIYEFNFTGVQGDSGYTDISLDFSGLGYGEAGKVRIYEVGKGLIRDVTTQVDTEREVVTGRVNTLGSYVLVEHF